MSNQTINNQRIITQTKNWIEAVVVGQNFCPFAKREVESDRVRYKVTHESGFDSLLNFVIQECVWLDQNKDTETTLIILPSDLNDFNAFLDCLGLAEDLLVAQSYEGIYQIASFHPDYCFQGEDDNDAANYTNRSPYPMMHLIREASIQLAIENHPDADAIPVRNVEHARELGLEKMKSLLAECINKVD